MVRPVPCLLAAARPILAYATARAPMCPTLAAIATAATTTHPATPATAIAATAPATCAATAAPATAVGATAAGAGRPGPAPSPPPLCCKATSQVQVLTQVVTADSAINTKVSGKVIFISS